MAIAWDTNLSIGVTEIDDQHKELFRRFNDLLEACNQGKGRDEVQNLLLFLHDYIKTHFRDEEKLQLAHNYPGYAAHKLEHERFVHTIDQFAQDFNEKGATIALVIQVNKSVVHWLIQHISKVDRELGNFIQKQP